MVHDFIRKTYSYIHNYIHSQIFLFCFYHLVYCDYLHKPDDFVLIIHSFELPTMPAVPYPCKYDIQAFLYLALVKSEMHLFFEF